MTDYDALLLLSFGGPNEPDDVMPFLRNVTRGRRVPEDRLAEVAARYQRFGGKSPINAENEKLLEALRAEIPGLPVYWGNRNWHPYVSDTIARMAGDGVKRAIVFATSAYSSYSSCRQYLENIGDAPFSLEKIPPFSNHPGFIEANRARLQDALLVAADGPRDDVLGDDRPLILFTAHSLPQSMADGCDYEAELETTAKAVLDGIDPELPSRVVYQSRSGPPQVPWLGPDVLDALREVAAEGVKDVVLAPIGFVCDHMEVVFDLDVEAKALASELGIRLRRAKTVGTHPRFVRMVRELVEEPLRQCCGPECCPPPSRG